MQVHEEAPSPEILQRRKNFTAALRSGKYQQGAGQLSARSIDDTWHHCCLGVACLVAIEDGMPMVATAFEGEMTYTPAGAQTGETTLPPRALADWYGWRDIDPMLPFVDAEHPVEENFHLSAASINDGQGWDFAQIADAFDTEYVAPYEPEDPSGVLES
jgi:hypothetical protein